MGELVRCDRQNLTLSAQGCARLWRSAQEKRPEPWEGRWHCRSCPIGARHAGVDLEAVRATSAADAVRVMCARCCRVGDRMIQEVFCVSCYNRHREAMLGRNHKGGVPRILRRLHTETICAGGTILRFDHVASRPEAAILAAKQARGARLMIGRPPLVLRTGPDLLAPVGFTLRPPPPRRRARPNRARPRRRPVWAVQMELAL